MTQKKHYLTLILKKSILKFILFIFVGNIINSLIFQYIFGAYYRFLEVKVLKL